MLYSISIKIRCRKVLRNCARHLVDRHMVSKSTKTSLSFEPVLHKNKMKAVLCNRYQSSDLIWRQQLNTQPECVLLLPRAFSFALAACAVFMHGHNMKGRTVTDMVLNTLLILTAGGIVCAAHHIIYTLYRSRY